MIKFLPKGCPVSENTKILSVMLNVYSQYSHKQITFAGEKEELLQK